MNLCFVCNEIPPAPFGGIGPVVNSLATEIKARGHSVTVIGLYDRIYNWKNIKYDFIPLIWNPSYKSIISTFQKRILLYLKLKEISKHCRFDIIEWPDYEGLYWKRLPPICEIVRNHGPSLSHYRIGVGEYDGGGKAGKVQGYFELRILRSLPYWIGVSRWFTNEWLTISAANPKRVSVIYNPIDTNLFLPRENVRGSGLILYAGGLKVRKGVFQIAKASRLFLEQLPGSHLLFIGRDPQNGRAREKIIEYAGEKAMSRIHFMDPISQQELAQFMAEADLFIMPSLLESFGNGWAEAMASGTPVIGSLYSCGPEIVPDKMAGVLVDPMNIDDIAKQTIMLMRDKPLRREFGIKGRKIALERYSLPLVVDQTLEYYRKCIEEK